MQSDVNNIIWSTQTANNGVLNNDLLKKLFAFDYNNNEFRENSEQFNNPQ